MANRRRRALGTSGTGPTRKRTWWIEKLGLKHQFEYKDGIAVGNDAVTIALFKGEPHPETIDHMSFHLPSITELHEALRDLKSAGVDLEDPDNEIGPGLRVLLTLDSGFTMETGIVGNCRCSKEFVADD